MACSDISNKFTPPTEVDINLGCGGSDFGRSESRSGANEVCTPISDCWCQWPSRRRWQGHMGGQLRAKWANIILSREHLPWWYCWWHGRYASTITGYQAWVVGATFLFFLPLSHSVDFEETFTSNVSWTQCKSLLSNGHSLVITWLGYGTPWIPWFWQALTDWALSNLN